MSMYNNVSKYDHLSDPENINKKWAFMHKYVSKRDYLRVPEDFKKNVGPCTILHENTIIYETQNIFRKMYLHVQ